MYIKVRAITQAKEEVVEQITSDHYKVSVREPAEQNRANARILELFRERYPNARLRIVSGHHSPSKIISIDTPEDI